MNNIVTAVILPSARLIIRLVETSSWDWLVCVLWLGCSCILSVDWNKAGIGETQHQAIWQQVGRDPSLKTGFNLESAWTEFGKCVHVRACVCVNPILQIIAPLLLHFSSPLPLLRFDFLFQWWDRETELPFSRLSIIPLSVPLSHLIGVGGTQAPSQRARSEQCRPV